MKALIAFVVSFCIGFLLILGCVHVFASEKGPDGSLPVYTEIFSRMIFGDSLHEIKDAKNLPYNSNNNVFPLNGNVGIGTLNRPEKLTVNGNVLAYGDVCTSAGKCLSSVCNGGTMYEDGLIFYATFDSELNATYADGNKSVVSSSNASRQFISGTDYGVNVSRSGTSHFAFRAQNNINMNKGTIEMWVKGGDLKDGNSKFLFDVQKDNQANLAGPGYTTLNYNQRFYIKNSSLSSGTGRLDFFIFEKNISLIRASITNLSSLNNTTWYKIRATWDTALSVAMIEVVGSGLSAANSLSNKPNMSLGTNTNMYIGSQVGGSLYASDNSQTQYGKIIREMKIFNTMK